LKPLYFGAPNGGAVTIRSIAFYGLTLTGNVRLPKRCHSSLGYLPSGRSDMPFPMTAGDTATPAWPYCGGTAPIGLQMLNADCAFPGLARGSQRAMVMMERTADEQSMILPDKKVKPPRNISE
jgi:hypothetical protein